MTDAGDRPLAKRGRPSPIDSAFEEHRNTIARLWSTENRPLPDVIQLMQVECGFSATYASHTDQLVDVTHIEQTKTIQAAPESLGSPEEHSEKRNSSFGPPQDTSRY